MFIVCHGINISIILLMKTKVSVQMSGMKILLVLWSKVYLNCILLSTQMNIHANIIIFNLVFFLFCLFYYREKMTRWANPCSREHQNHVFSSDRDSQLLSGSANQGPRCCFLWFPRVRGQAGSSSPYIWSNSSWYDVKELT